jgi:D-serine deaminase-like pyridoxal phosphate-dependent protein
MRGTVAHIEDFARRLDASLDVKQKVQDVLSALAAKGLGPLTVTGGSTGSLFIDSRNSVFTELQCGSYIFMDAEYSSVDLDGAATPVFRTSLFVRTSIISRNQPGLATTDAGFKHFAGSPLPRVHSGPAAGLRYEPTSDEHGRITIDRGVPGLDVGDGVECIVPHCDPTLNLYDHLHVVRGDTLIAIWPIEARGAI